MSGPVSPGPRWSPDRWISPTALNSYRTCALRVRLKYLDKIPEPFVYNVFLAKGRIAHDILRSIAYALARGQTPVGSDRVLEMARTRLPRQEFPSEDLRLVEAADIARWVGVGRRYIEGIPNPEWVLIEKMLRREWRIFPKVAPYMIMARPDAVLQRQDLEGQPVFEIVDYKTGKRRPDPMPPVVMRFVARDLLRERIGNASSANVRFTYLWLNTGEKDIRELSVEFCNDEWTEILTDLERLARESEWKPTPSFLCNYCPYHQNVCTEEIPLTDTISRPTFP